jgi:D-alanyl-D-alanine dipeptidase
MKRLILSIIFISAWLIVEAQHYKYIDSSKVMALQSYLKDIKTHPETRLVEIKKYIPDIVLDIRRHNQ